MARSRKGRLEADRGSSTAGVSVAQLLDADEAKLREETRKGLKELDAMTEASQYLSRRSKDANRILPRDGTGEINPRKRRTFADHDTVRTPISSRQRLGRARDLLATQKRWTAAQAREVREIFSNPEKWSRINDQLSEHVGDIDALSTRDKARAKRLDRAIRQFEETNKRTHVLYTAMQLPKGMRVSEVKEGQKLVFDRFTMAHHDLHQVESGEDRLVVIEMETSRGMFLAPPGDVHTGHLLPRGLRFTVGETYEASWTDGKSRKGKRQVIRLYETKEES